MKEPDKKSWSKSYHLSRVSAGQPWGLEGRKRMQEEGTVLKCCGWMGIKNIEFWLWWKNKGEWRQWQRVNQRMSQRSSGERLAHGRREHFKRRRALCEFHVKSQEEGNITELKWRESKGNEDNRFHQMGPSPATEKGRASSPSLREGITSTTGKGKDPSENQAWEFTNMEPVQLGAGWNTFPHPEASPLEWDSETQNAEEHSLHWTGIKQLGRKRKTYFRGSQRKRRLLGRIAIKIKAFKVCKHQALKADKANIIAYLEPMLDWME